MAKKFISQEHSTQTGGRGIKDGTRKSRAGSIFATAFFGLAIIFGVGLIAFTAIFFYSDVDGTSMMKTLNASGVNTDSVLVKRGDDAKRGDIIVVQHYDSSGNKKALHIKRLLATEGDTIYFERSAHNGAEYPNFPDGRYYYKIHINGVAYDTINAGKYHIYDEYEAQVAGTGEWTQGWMRGSDIYDKFYNFILTGNHYFSAPGSRTDALFRTHAADNTPFRVYNNQESRWEIKLPKGYMFYMGDNRGNDDLNPATGSTFGMSSDCTNYGPQPRSHLVGVAVDHASGKSAPEWFFSKIIEIVTFGFVK